MRKLKVICYTKNSSSTGRKSHTRTILTSLSVENIIQFVNTISDEIVSPKIIKLAELVPEVRISFIDGTSNSVCVLRGTNDAIKGLNYVTRKIYELEKIAEFI